MSKIYNPEYHREYYAKNKERISKRISERYKTDDEYKKQSKDRAWKHTVQKRYGIDVDQYDAMFIKQEGKCAICFTHQSDLKIRLAVDHNHSTGEVRGLLCDNCNRGIGHLKESQDVLSNAISYLKGKK